MTGFAPPQSQRISRAKWPIMLVLCILLGFVLRGDNWRTEVSRFFGAISDYESAITYLITAYPAATTADRPPMEIILAYCHRMLADPEAEKHWLGLFFTRPQTPEITFALLREPLNIELTNYLVKWIETYPRLGEIILVQDRFAFKDRPKTLSLIVQSGNRLQYHLRSSGRTIKTGELLPGKTIIELPPLDYGEPLPAGQWLLEASAAAVSIKKQIRITYAYEKPDEVEIRNHQIHLAGRQLLDENMIEQRDVTRNYFDHRRFFSRVLPCFGAATAVFATNHLLVHPHTDDQGLSPGTLATYRAVSPSLNLLAVALTIKALVHLRESFRQEKKSLPISTPNEEASRANRELQRLLDQAATRVYIRFQLHLDGEEK